MTRLPDGSYEIRRMAPPGTVAFAFSVAEKKTDETAGFVVDGGHEVVDVEDVAGGIAPPEELGLMEVNTLVVPPRPKGADGASVADGAFDGAEGPPGSIRLLPRTMADAPPVKKKKKAVAGWTLKNSVFAAYKSDTTKVLDAAFTSDFDRCRSGKNSGKASFSKKSSSKMSTADIAAAAAADAAAFRASVLSAYKLVKECFRHYGAAYTDGIWTVGANAFGQFVADLGILPEEEEEGEVSESRHSAVKTFNRVEVDLIFVAACGTGGKTLNRHQFLDAFVQLAICRFVKFGTPRRGQAEAVKELTAEHAAKNAERDPYGRNFKEKFLHNSTVDGIIRAEKEDLLVAFKMHSGRDDMPGEARTMSMPEYMELLTALNLDGVITERSMKLSFVRAKETTVDETEARSRHKKLNFVEFLEAMGRVAFAVYCVEKDERETVGMVVDLPELNASLETVFGKIARRARVAKNKKKMVAAAKNAVAAEEGN